MLLCFFSFHLHMVLRNETTIEGSSPAFDMGWRRNAAAAQPHNFVTRDGITPDAFRAAVARVDRRSTVTAVPARIWCVGPACGE